MSQAITRSIGQTITTQFVKQSDILLGKEALHVLVCQVLILMILQFDA